MQVIYHFSWEQNHKIFKLVFVTRQLFKKSVKNEQFWN